MTFTNNSHKLKLIYCPITSRLFLAIAIFQVKDNLSCQETAHHKREPREEKIIYSPFTSM